MAVNFLTCQKTFPNDLIIWKGVVLNNILFLLINNSITIFSFQNIITIDNYMSIHNSFIYRTDKGVFEKLKLINDIIDNIRKIIFK